MSMSLGATVAMVGVSVVLPITLVSIVSRYKLKSEQNRKDIILAALEKDANVNIGELVGRFNRPRRLIKERLLAKLLVGSLFTIPGLGLLLLAAVMGCVGGFYTDTIFFTGIWGAITLSIGAAFLITYFIGKKSLAQEQEIELNNMSRQ